MKCPSCQSNNPQSAKFCVECGNKFESICPKCGISNSSAFKFCYECGADLKSLKETISVDYSSPHTYTPKFLADKILTTRSSIEGERKLVTVLFADVANYTSIAEKLDPEEIHQMMDGCFKILMDEIHKYEGTINQFTGDGVMALFGAPVAHEDHAQRACHAALSIQKALKVFEEKIKNDFGADFKMRIGLNSGPVVVGSIGDDLRMDYTAVGDTSNLASRIENMAEPGTSLVSGHTHKLAGDFFEFKSLGKVELKGKEALQEAFELIKAGEVVTRIGASVAKGLSRFVGREKSIASLMEAYEKTQSGSGQIVGIVGEAGVGKSRLLLEFKKRLSNDNFIYLEGRCLQYGGSMVYLPVLDILRSYFEFKDGDQSLLIKKKMEKKILQHDEKMKGALPAFHELLSLKVEDQSYQKLQPMQKREKAFEAIRDLLVRESLDRPIILVVEDLHWIDKTSEEFLSYLIEWLENCHILLILLYRPEYTHTWGSKSYYAKIGLTQLTSQSSAELIRAILYDCEIEPGLETLILNRSAGTPLYIEELTHSLLENGSIQREQNQCFLAIEPKDIQIPDTIQGIIAARMDRLEDNTKRTMQVASVIGRDFAFRILQTITGRREELKSYLRNLQGLEFIYEKSLFPELEYIFKHALTQEVAYNSLLHKRKKEIHGKIGKAIEELYSERLEEFYEILAYHFVQAEGWEKAFLYLFKSGEKTRQAYANNEAIAFYTHAIEVSGRTTPALDEEELLSVYEGRGLVWMLQTRLDDAIADFRTMLELARTTGNKKKVGESLCHLTYSHFSKFSEDQVPFIEQYAQEALQLSQQIGDQKVFAKSLLNLGLMQQWRGNLPEADRKLEESMQICRREEYKDSLAQNLLWLNAQAYWQGNISRAIPFCQESLAVSREIHDGLSELFNLAFLCLEYGSLGDYDQAFTVLYEGMAKAKERKNKFILGRLTNTLGWFHRELGDFSRALEFDLESMEIGRMHRIDNVEISALINLGFDYFALGQHERALSYLEPTLERVEREAFGSHRWRWKAKLPIGLAELSYVSGAYEEALRQVDEGIKVAQDSSSQKYVAKGRVLRGKIVAKLGDSDAAGTELQRAFTLAEQLRSPTIVYPAAYDLGQWYETTGQEKKAAMLYGKAKAAAEHIAATIKDETLSAIFHQSAPVQEIYDCASRLGSQTPPASLGT